jgi:hypothetical protein
MPPTRILSWVVPLTAWLGWHHIRKKNGDIFFSQKIAEAFESEETFLLEEEQDSLFY